MNKKQTISLGLALTAALVALVVFLLQENPEARDDKGADESSRTIADAAVDGIDLRNEVGDLTPIKSPPSDWKAFRDEQFNLSLVYPAEWTIASRQPTKTAGSEDVSRLSIYYQFEGTRQCVLDITSRPFVDVVRELENSDIDDDGKVVESPKRIYEDIVSKDPFLIKGFTGIKFVKTLRASNSSEVRRSTIYIIDTGRFTYRFTFSGDSDVSDENIVKYSLEK